MNMKIIFNKEIITFLESLSTKDRVRIDRIKELFEDYGFQIGPKYIKKIRDNLWELRAGKIRIFLCIKGEFAYGVHAIYKKTQKLPKQEIRLSIKRCQQI